MSSTCIYLDPVSSTCILYLDPAYLTCILYLDPGYITYILNLDLVFFYLDSVLKVLAIIIYTLYYITCNLNLDPVSR